jgi:hypothetical protein
VSELISTSDSETADVELQKEIEESDERRAELQKIVFDIDDRLNLMLQSSQAAASQTNTMSGNSEQIKAKHVVRAKLPKLQAKTFDGKVQEWQEFWESFESAIHQNECMFVRGGQIYISKKPSSRTGEIEYCGVRTYCDELQGSTRVVKKQVQEKERNPESSHSITAKTKTRVQQ